MTKLKPETKKRTAPTAAALREKDAQRRRDESARNRLVIIPPCKNRARRNKLQRNDAKWLRWYFGTHDSCSDPFWYEFTEQQLAMISAIRNAIKYGGDQSLAASRGEGKTTIFERMLLKYTLSGVISFSVLFAATGQAAENSLETIKMAIEENDRLCDDYPEVCVPVRALENVPNRAHYQIVEGTWHTNAKRKFSGHSSRFRWCGQEIVFPDVPGSPSRGAILATRGLDAAVRGLKKRGRRPDVAGIDDPDTEDTVRSEEQAGKLEQRIDRAIGGLGGQQKSIARVMLTTIQNRNCVSYRFTDPTDKPTWKGKRFRFLVRAPNRPDLWDDYVQMRHADLQTGDEFARGAHQFYLTNRATMDAGAVVANVNRFSSQTLPDGTQLEVSALQRYYNEIAKIGADAVASELDNDPPEEVGPVESGLTAHRIQTQTSGYARGIIPPGCTVITQGIDVRKVALHWVVRAWRPDATGYVIDYGVHEVYGTTYGNDEGVDVAIVRAIRGRMTETTDAGYCTVDGEIMPVGMTLVDAGWRTDAVYHACRELGLGIMPAMGFGKSAGCAQPRFSSPVRSHRDRRPGDGWFRSKRPKGVWLICTDADRWKAWEHDRWMTPTDKPGALFMWGESDGGKRMSHDQKSHHAYAHHVVSEIEVEEPVKGVLVRRWKAKSGNNHWLDASYMADVAANMKGIVLMTPKPKAEMSQRPSLTAMAGK
ncbi:MAG TPA: terminase gpA endonuclease subunit [Pirellulales bacterium]|nr:terminase gpA endonuclease subunit [Pirellulales bacterium]